MCTNRTYDAHDETNDVENRGADLYYYVDEETSELIQDYYFARDLTLTLGNRNEIHDLCTDFR